VRRVRKGRGAYIISANGERGWINALDPDLGNSEFDTEIKTQVEIHMVRCWPE
jgi:hypothetical protein